MDDPQDSARSRLTAERAFVVHLFEKDGVHGRVEHVTSGRCRRFVSTLELIDFMQGILGVPDLLPGSSAAGSRKC